MHQANKRETFPNSNVLRHGSRLLSARNGKSTGSPHPSAIEPDDPWRRNPDHDRYDAYHTTAHPVPEIPEESGDKQREHERQDGA